MKTVLVDIYGADIGPEPIIEGALSALTIDSELQLCFIGEESLIMGQVEKTGADKHRVRVIHTTDFVTNHEPPVCVFKGRDQSSLVLGLQELKNNPDAIGLISPGNTGALLVGSIFRLGLVSGLKSPALCSVMPCCDGKLLALLDCGANMDCTADDLVRYALMGDALMRSLGESDSPRIGLLSVGREDSKGNRLTLEAHGKLTQLPVNFVGNIEGLDVVSGDVEVIVADGFSGNILMKTIEAVGKSAISAAEDAMAQYGDTTGALQAVKNRLSNAYDFNPRGGATFLGTEKPVIKMHGSATAFTPYSCIQQLLKMEKAQYRNALITALQTYSQ